MSSQKVRDELASVAWRIARRLSTPGGWRHILASLGAPDMATGLSRMRGLRVLPDEVNVIDAGAFVGNWTRLLRSVYPHARVLMVEAQPRCHEALTQLVQTDPRRLQFVNTVLGPENKDAVDFHLLDDPSGGTGSSMLAENSNIPRTVVQLPMRTLDDVIESAQFPAPQFIKLDVQGYELEVLKGARNALSSAQCVLLEVSTWQYNENAPLIDEILTSMKDAGFVMYDLFDVSRRPDDTLVQLDVLFLSESSPIFSDRITRF